MSSKVSEGTTAAPPAQKQTLDAGVVRGAAVLSPKTVAGIAQELREKSNAAAVQPIVSGTVTAV